MKKFVAFICSLVILLSLPMSVSHADENINIYLNGERVYFSDQQPAIIEGRTLVPLRGVFEAMGADVTWDGYWEEVFIDFSSGIELTMFIGDYSMLYMDNHSSYSIDLDVPARIINDRTMVPLRAISESIGADVEWNSTSRSVYISYSDQTSYSGSSDADYDEPLPLFDNTDEYDYYFVSYPEIINFGWYIDIAPYYSTREMYVFDYSGYEYNIADDIDNYIEDMKDEDFELDESYNKNGARYYEFSGNGYSVLFINDYSLEHIEVQISRLLGSSSKSTPNPTAAPTAKPAPTPAPTAKPTAAPTQAPEFDYLKDLGWKITDKDYSLNSVSTESKNAVAFKVYLNTKKNAEVGLEKGDKARIVADFDLAGDYNRLTGTMHGTSSHLSFNFYCDGELVKGYTGVRADTALDLDVSGCNHLRIEAYGIVGSYVSQYTAISIKEAKLWH